MASTPAMAQALAPQAAPPADPPWRPCGWCFGQRQIHLPVRDEPGRYVAARCPRCLGIGEEPSR